MVAGDKGPIGYKAIPDNGIHKRYQKKSRKKQDCRRQESIQTAERGQNGLTEAETSHVTATKTKTEDA